MINDLMKIISNQQAQRLTLKGKTIKWNNQVQINNRSSWTVRGLTMKIQDGTFEVNGTATGSEYAYNDIEQSQYPTSLLKVGHKYFVGVRLLSGSVSNEGNNAYIVASSPYDETSSYSGNAYIFTCTASSYILVRVNAVNCTYNNCKFAPYFIDLTEIGLADISSVEEFYRTALGYQIKNGLVLPFSATNQIMSVETPFTFKGRNLINYKTEYDTSSFALNGNVLENIVTDTKTNFQAQLQAYIGGQYYYGTDKRIDRNGRYVFYITIPNFVSSNDWVRFKHNGNVVDINAFYLHNLETGGSFALSADVLGYNSSVVGGLKLANIQLEKGNKATPYLAYDNQLVYTRTKRVDLGTLDFYQASGTTRFTCTQLANQIKKPSDININPNIRCTKYGIDTPYNIWRAVNDKKISLYPSGNDTWIIIVDSDLYGMTQAQIKQALSGVILEYETAEPLELNGFDNVYDTFENHSGKVVRKIGKIKLNDANITYSNHTFNLQLTDIEVWTNQNEPTKNLMVADYQVVSINGSAVDDICIAQRTYNVMIKDSRYSSVSALKSAKGNVVIYYKLATPTTETERSVLADHRYNKVVDANGIEIDTD